MYHSSHVILFIVLVKTCTIAVSVSHQFCLGEVLVPVLSVLDVLFVSQDAVIVRDCV